VRLSEFNYFDNTLIVTENIYNNNNSYYNNPSVQPILDNYNLVYQNVRVYDGHTEDRTYQKMYVSRTMWYANYGSRNIKMITDSTAK